MGLAPKLCTFYILADDINIVGDIPFKFGAIQLLNQLCAISQYVWTQSPVSPQQRTVVMEVSPKWCTFCILSVRFSVTYYTSMPCLLQLDECAEYSMEVPKPEARTVGGSVASSPWARYVCSYGHRCWEVPLHVSSTIGSGIGVVIRIVP